MIKAGCKVATLLLCLLTTTLVAAKDTTVEKKTVKAQKVVINEIFDTYKYPVVIEPKYERGMYAEFNGFVQDIYVNVGSMVTTNTSLMDLKATDPGRTSQALTMKSPMSGQITQVGKKIGSYVKTGDLLVHIVDPNNFSIKIEVPQAELALLADKPPGEAEFRGVDGHLPVVVIGVSALIDPATGTASGQLDWDKKNFKANEARLIHQHIYPGMLGYVTFKLHYRKGILIPSRAILYEKQQAKVRIVKDGKANKVIVKLGKLLAGGQQEIIAGLQVGDMVVVATGKYVRENEDVLLEEMDAGCEK